jgi:hypothetical protein
LAGDVEFGTKRYKSIVLAFYDGRQTQRLLHGSSVNYSAPLEGAEE